MAALPETRARHVSIFKGMVPIEKLEKVAAAACDEQKLFRI